MVVPKRKDCRVDYKNSNSGVFTFLIEYGSEDMVLYYEFGVKQLKDIYSTFKFKVENNMSIDNWVYQFTPYRFKKIPNVEYDYPHFFNV